MQERSVSFVKSEAEVLLLGLTRRLHRFMFMCMGGRHFYKNTAGSVGLAFQI